MFPFPSSSHCCLLPSLRPSPPLLPPVLSCIAARLSHGYESLWVSSGLTHCQCSRLSLSGHPQFCSGSPLHRSSLAVGSAVFLIPAFKPQEHSLGPLVWVHRKTSDLVEADGVAGQEEECRRRLDLYRVGDWVESHPTFC